MFVEKESMINCDVCDIRKMKEEDCSDFKDITINADILILNEESKSTLNRLPIMIYGYNTIELDGDTKAYVKTINGLCEITKNSSIAEHTILRVNGLLKVHSGTEEILKKYDGIIVNGGVKYPKSLESFIEKMSINGAASAYPDDCIIY